MVCMDLGDVCREDARQDSCENKLACARGLIWAVAFQVSVATAIAIFWKLYSIVR
jgi:hypothetical protein